MSSNLRFLLNRLSEILWIKPLVVCIFSIGLTQLASLADEWTVNLHLPEVSQTSVVTLLQISASSMLVIATFAVGSMISAYASAGSTATPRSFPLLVADDISQAALSVFVGTFIFSIVSLVAVQNGYYGPAGYLTIFVFALIALAIVIVTFIFWVDRVARLGRPGNTIELIESATHRALVCWMEQPHMGGRPLETEPSGSSVTSDQVGYIQRIDIEKLQKVAEQSECTFSLLVLPGDFVTSSTPLICVSGGCDNSAAILGAFKIGHQRTYDEDPRFGFIALSEIAVRAMSPALNDPGTAVDVIQTQIRLLTTWEGQVEGEDAVEFDRVQVPGINVADLFNDAFRVIARHAASTPEVAIFLRRCLASLSGTPALASQAEEHAKMVLSYCEHAGLPESDMTQIRKASPD